MYFNTNLQIASDELCHLCRKPVFDGYPCRVCTRNFHNYCLEDCGRYRGGELKCLDAAKTNTGWSCYQCVNIGIYYNNNQNTI